MKIHLNGQIKDCASSQNLQTLVEEFCRDHKRIIAELNGEIVKSQSWAQTTLREGDVIELVSFVGGG